jgi:hypothetical protein
MMDAKLHRDWYSVKFQRDKVLTKDKSEFRDQIGGQILVPGRLTVTEVRKGNSDYSH